MYVHTLYYNSQTFENCRLSYEPCNVCIDTIHMLYTYILLYGIHNHVIFSLYGSQNNV